LGSKAMAANQLNKVVRYLRDILPTPAGSLAADGELLRGYVKRRDEAAFESLVKRHGPMVLGVCRRVLHNAHDAEDAFQATFLVLVRKAASIRSPDTVGNWLYGVAYRNALAARRAATRRQARESRGSELRRPDPRNDPWENIRPVLDQELARLPDKYRIVVVVCDLEEKSRKEAAELLGLPEGTVASRLARARAMLANRLIRHGLVLSAASLTSVLSENVSSASVPASLMSVTVKAAPVFVAGETAASVFSTGVINLTEGVLKSMFLAKLRLVAVGSLLAGVVCASVAIYPRLLRAEPNQSREADKAVPDNVAKDKPDTQRVDQAKQGQLAEDSKLRTLFKERLAAVKGIEAEIEKLYRAERATPQELLPARQAVLRAELDLSNSDKERIAIHEKIIGIAKQLEEQMNYRFQAGHALLSDVLRTRVSRLEAEIDLERAREGAGTRHK
jgi:RNA polymerase sigma factor (sigma-70 family)